MKGVVSAIDRGRVAIRGTETGDAVLEAVLPAIVLTPLFLDERFVVTEIGQSPNAGHSEAPGYQVAAIDLETGTVSIFDTTGVPDLLGDLPAASGR